MHIRIVYINKHIVMSARIVYEFTPTTVYLFLIFENIPKIAQLFIFLGKQSHLQTLFPINIFFFVF